MQENITDDWWSDAEEVLSQQDLTSVSFLGESGIIGFVPPPPRPSIFTLEDLGSEAFSASCDLCDWAWKDQVNANRSLLLPILPTAALGGELGWLLTLAAVALLSAVIGAAVMVIVLHCRRLKGIGNSGCCQPSSDECAVGNPQNVPPDLHSDTSKTPPLPETRAAHGARRGFWRSLLWTRNSRHTGRGSYEGRMTSTQRRAPRRLCPPAPPASENHYTVTEPVSPTVTPAVEEALYAELQEQGGGYQNTSYLQVSEPDLPSAPSSAYYSDLSCGADRMYEAVQGEETPNWGTNDEIYQPTYNDLVLNTVACRIATITKTVPSDYV